MRSRLVAPSLITLALLWLPGCPEDKVARVFGRLEVTPADLDFGSVVLAERRAFMVELSNVGQAPLLVQVAVTGERVSGVRVPLHDLTLAPGAMKMLEVGYVPEELGEMRGEV